MTTIPVCPMRYMCCVLVWLANAVGGSSSLARRAFLTYSLCAIMTTPTSTTPDVDYLQSLGKDKLIALLLSKQLASSETKLEVKAETGAESIGAIGDLSAVAGEPPAEDGSGSLESSAVAAEVPGAVSNDAETSVEASSAVAAEVPGVVSNDGETSVEASSAVAAEPSNNVSATDGNDSCPDAQPLEDFPWEDTITDTLFDPVGGGVDSESACDIVAAADPYADPCADAMGCEEADMAAADESLASTRYYPAADDSLASTTYYASGSQPLESDSITALKDDTMGKAVIDVDADADAHISEAATAEPSEMDVDDTYSDCNVEA